ncbi:MAG: hypothetical protein ACP5HH_03905 [Fervidicoccaceae archaeon]
MWDLSHPDPAGAHIESIREAKRITEREGRHLVIIGYVLGVEGDPQGFSEQKKKLEAEGVKFFTFLKTSFLKLKLMVF